MKESRLESCGEFGVGGYPDDVEILCYTLTKEEQEIATRVGNNIRSFTGYLNSLYQLTPGSLREITW